MTIHLNKILNWLEAKYGLTKYKQKEIELRNEIISDYGSSTVEGKEKETVGDYLVEYSYGITRGLDRAELDTIWDELSDEEKDCIDFAPKIKLKEYRALEESNPDSLLFSCITVKPSQANIKVTEINDE